MTETANNHQFSYVTIRTCKIRRPPRPDWKAQNILPSVKTWPEDGSILEGLTVYSDNAQIPGADGYMWVDTEFGWIRTDGLKLYAQKVPTPAPQPIPDTPGELAAIAARLRDLNNALELLVIALERMAK